MRGGQTVCPDAGRGALRGKARKMLELKKEFDEAMAEIRDNKRGKIRVGVQLRRETWLLPPVLFKFASEYPGIEVVIREGNMWEISQMLERYELDWC